MVQKEFFGAAAASDIILWATVNTPGHFQLMIGLLLDMVPIPKALRDILHGSIPTYDLNGMRHINWKVLLDGFRLI